MFAIALVALAPAVANPLAVGPVSVADDGGQVLTLVQPARRIISLAPHLTEMLYAAGAGERVVGAVAYSNFPVAATRLPQVGSAHALDLERLVALKPDLVVVWRHGTPPRQLEALQRLGLPIWQDESKGLDDIARSLERLGTLAGTEPAARAAALAYRTRLAALRSQYAARSPVSVFHQVWHQPLMTVNRTHIISDVITLCGGRNVFADDDLLVPRPSLEAVIRRDPEFITQAGEGDAPADFSAWRAWPRLKAVARGQVLTLPGDLISRQSPRLLDAAQLLCEALDRARAKR